MKSKLHLFIDTNILLAFYHFSKEDLEKLAKFSNLILQEKKIKLYVSSQLVNELNRNRENQIKSTLKKLTNSNIKIDIPLFCFDYPEVKIIQKAEKNIEKAQKQLLEKLKKDVSKKNLSADKIINKLFFQQTNITKDLILAAQERFDLGNPPGKNRSYGDAINWEFLLKVVPQKEDFYLITGDNDYSSPLDEYVFSQFLREEWEKKKNSQIYFYRSLNQFFKDKFSHFELHDDFFKDLKIQEFTESSSFLIAYLLLKELGNLGNFSELQLNNIIKASILNPYIYKKGKYYSSIRSILQNIIEDKEKQIETSVLEKFRRLF